MSIALRIKDALKIIVNASFATSRNSYIKWLSCNVIGFEIFALEDLNELILHIIS